MGLVYLGDDLFREGIASWGSLVGHLNVGAGAGGDSHRGLDVGEGPE